MIVPASLELVARMSEQQVASIGFATGGTYERSKKVSCKLAVADKSKEILLFGSKLDFPRCQFVREYQNLE